MSEGLQRVPAHATALAEIWKHVRQRVARQGADLAHDFEHLRRVWSNAEEIAAAGAREEHWTVDMDVLEASVALHDIGRGLEEGDEHHSEASCRIAEELLRAHRLEDLVWPVCEAILAHSWSSDREASSVEGRILRDADRLDALGAIGIARALVTGAHRATPALYSCEDPWAKSRELDDRAFVMDHFPRKLFKIPETMLTRYGRALGERRLRILRAFYEALLQDVGAGRASSIESVTKAS